MKGQSWQIEEMLKIFLVMVVFLGAVLLIIASTGGLNSVLEEFCLKNPTWCGEHPPCVCCEIRANAKTGLGMEDYYSNEYIWTTSEQCYDLLDDNNGNAYWPEDVKYSACGYTTNSEISSGIVFHDTCSVPEQYVREGMPDCVCCAYQVSPTHINVIWDMDWRCQERDSYSIENETLCGPMYLLPEEAQELTLKRIGKFFGIGGQYCEIPEPYNYTEAP